VDLEERTWLPRHCRGDRSAFPALLEAYRRPVYSYLVRSGVAADDRDDVFQSIFLKVHAAAASYQPGRPLAPWIFTIAANTVRNHRRGQRGANSWAAHHEPQELADPNPGPERVVQAREAVAMLERAMAALPFAQREALVLSVVTGLRQREVAEALDLPLNTVKTHLRRARLALPKALAGSHGPAADVGDADEQV
jgi:RNA polymerase sigma-70 factor (ECF subfamily)